jgi:preprotein translocase subunit SecG
MLLLSFVAILKGLLLFLLTLTALLLILIVLLQEPKGGGLAAAFGGAGAETFGVQSGSVNKFTTYVAGAFIFMAIVYAMIRPAGADDTAPSDTVPELSAPENTGGGDGTGDGGGG